MQPPFTPAPGASQQIAVGSASAAVILVVPSTDAIQARAVLTNTGASVVWVAFGTATAAVAAGSGYPILPNTKELVGIPIGATHIATLAAGGGTLIVSPGIGA